MVVRGQVMAWMKSSYAFKDLSIAHGAHDVCAQQNARQRIARDYIPARSGDESSLFGHGKTCAVSIGPSFLWLALRVCASNSSSQRVSDHPVILDSDSYSSLIASSPHPRSTDLNAPALCIEHRCCATRQVYARVSPFPADWEQRSKSTLLSCEHHTSSGRRS